ncbi:InlB B-repeat-containing protein [Roseburia intestinalis]|uniref:InlB B-repeat-containing protein n=1 Tax=Roseburia intestinalis TaxID=166486 RepID=UPI0035228A39
MKEKRKLNKGGKILLLFTLVVSSIFLLRPFTVKADVNVNINKETQIVTDLIGQYSINYTGDANFFGFYGYYENNNYNEMVKDTDFKATVDTIGKDKIVNSSIASLKKTDGATQIEAAYLVWETSVQGKNNTDLVKKAANKAVYFAGSTDKGAFTKKVNASYAAVDMREPHLGTKEYTFSCMYVDVTSVVQKYGYGKYGVANIPYAASMKTSNTDKGTHAGESSSAWQLIVIEKNSKANVRAVSLKIGSHFNYQQENSKWTRNPLTMNLDLGDCKTNQYINEDSEVSGELLLLGTNSGIVKSNATEQKSFALDLYDTQKDKVGKLAFSNSGLIGHSYFYHGDTQLSSKLSSVRGMLMDFTVNQDDGSHPGFATKRFRAEASDSSWSTLFVVGLAVDVADYELSENQETTVNSTVSATVTGNINVVTDQPNTGYYDGTLVVTLDDVLTPVKGKASFTVYDKGVTKPKAVKYIYGTDKEVQYNAANHTLTLSGYDNKADGSYVKYSIPCTVPENSGKKLFTNQHEVTGKLRSQKTNTGIEKASEPVPSQATPLYRLTVKMDKTAGSHIEIRKYFTQFGHYDLVCVVAEDPNMLSGDYYMDSVEIPYNDAIIATPAFNTGYQFSKWTDLNEKTKESKDRKVTSDYVNDKTYAYERSMPAYNMTLTLTGVGEPYEVRYYMNAPRALTGIDTWNVSNTYTLIGNSTAETVTKSYTGTQISSICGKTTPYIYKTYRYGNYYSAALSSSIKINGYRKVINGTHTKAGWWTAASGGTYVNVDGAASGDNQGKICASDWRGYAKSGTLSNGKKGKIISLYAHWELDQAEYTVRHWKQKADGIASTHDDKNYELAETETKKAQIGSKVTPAVKTYTGFDSPKTQTKAVTADGKMVIDYYYERHLYNVTLNAGTGIEKTTGGGSYRYGQSVTIDAAVKEGYHWLNWKGNYKGGSGGEQTVDAKKFVFTMPAGNVTMTANAEANKYTIHFDPNGGAGHIDDIEATYDEDVTLPDVWNADGTAAYVKYTLDGQNVTEDVIAGVIPKAMMAGYEEETEEIEDTEDPDNAEDPEGAGNSEDEDSENNGDDSDADAQNSMDESGNAETADNSDESDEAETADNSDESDDTGNPDVTDDTDQNEKVAVTKENKDDAEDIDALNDLEEEDIEENKKAEEPKKKVYASVFMGWSLEDGKDTFIPQWKAGDVVRNLVAEDGGEITLYAVWDDCPWIQAQDLYYTLEQAQSGFITEEEILSHATATDREDGSPILPGTNPAPSDPEVFTSFTIPDYQAGEFTNLQHDFATSENLTVVDHTGNTYVKQIMVYVTDTTPKKITQMDLTGVTRFINSKYYHKPYEEGGLEDNSIWKVDPEYKAALESALNNMDNDTPVETYVLSKETIKEIKKYVEDHGIGNSREPDALNNFYELFLAPNKQ